MVTNKPVFVRIIYYYRKRVPVNMFACILLQWQRLEVRISYARVGAALNKLVYITFTGVLKIYSEKKDGAKY